MKTRRRKLPVVRTAVLALAGTVAGTGQGRPDEPIDPLTGAVQDGAPQMAERELILEREAFTYPARGRRDPFLPLDVPSPHRPGIEEIRLLGIIHHPNPMYRVAIISFHGGFDTIGDAERNPATMPASRLRTGEVQAGMRIVAIEVDRVVVELEEPGGVTTRVLALPRAGRGRGS